MFTASGLDTLPAFSSVMIPGPWEEGCNIDALLRADHSIVSCSLHVDQLWVYIHCHLFQEDTSPLWVETATPYATLWE